MKNEIYNEIKTLENSSNDIQKRKGRCIRLLADNITCFKCIDTKRSWKNKNNLSLSFINNSGSCDIVGCNNCNNVGFISSSHTNNLIQNGFKVFHVDNNNWIERIEQIFNKASRDINIINKVNEWINETNKLKIKQVEYVRIESVKAYPDIIKPEKVDSEIIKSEKVEPERVETKRTEPVKVETIKVETMPLFEVCKRITKEHVEKSLDVEVEVGRIISIVKSAVEAYFGNVFSLVDLAKELTVSFSISNSKSIATDKLIKIKDNNFLGIKTCTKITQNVIKTRLFGRNKFAKEYIADIFILKPINQLAIEKALFIMGKIGKEMTDDILKEF